MAQQSKVDHQTLVFIITQEEFKSIHSFSAIENLWRAALLSACCRRPLLPPPGFVHFPGKAQFISNEPFVFIGLSAAIGDQNNSYHDQETKVAFAFGLGVATLAQCIGHVSGAHLNPAITLGLLASCQMSVLRAFFYIIAQILGAVAGSAIVYGIRPATTDSLGVNKLKGISPRQGFGVEFVLTLQLVLCVLAVTDKRRDVVGLAPLAIGLSVRLGHLAGISYTGCGINPARSFGPAIIQESFEDHWVYWAGPVSAGVVAALLYNYLLAPKDEPFSKQTQVLLCCGSTQDNEIQEPFLENVTERSKEII